MSVPRAAGSNPTRGNPLSRWFGRTVLKVLGWRIEGTLPDAPKVLAIAAPHSSNWDAVVGFATAMAMGLNVSWMGKHTLFRGPLNRLARWGGGIPVDRSGTRGQVSTAIAEFDRREQFWCAIAPEGTRRETTRWRTGFYRIAEGAQVPLFLCHFHYPTRTVGLGPLMPLSGDMTADLRAIESHYAPFRGKGGKPVRVLAAP
jgi:1-acyl-sn-glycerol-3-phosphate acyltransferase